MAHAGAGGRASSSGLKQQGGLVQAGDPAGAWSPPRSPDTVTATPPALSGNTLLLGIGEVNKPT